jgi:hypothetical protein
VATTTLTTSLPTWLTGGTYDSNGGDDLRNSGITAFFYDEGIVGGEVVGVLGGVVGGAGLQVTPGSGMTVKVQPGSYVVPNSGSPVSGGYSSTLAQQGTLNVQAADASNPRVDIVVAVVIDNGDNTSTGQIQYIAGAAAASPGAPDAPANSIVLAQITVPANTTAITSGMVADQRPFTTAAGGIIVAEPGTVTGYEGMAAFDKANGRFYHNSNTTGDTQFKTLPWAPIVAVRNESFGISGTAPTSMCQVGITTDGYTDIKVTYHWVGIYQPTVVGWRQVVFTVWLDDEQLDEVDLTTLSVDVANESHLGGTMVYSTSSDTGDTPSDGSHVVYFKGYCNNGVGSGDVPWVKATTTRNMYLRVEPVSL